MEKSVKSKKVLSCRAENLPEVSEKVLEVLECPVCFDDLPISSFVVCLCGTKVCQKCCKEYILECTEEAHCMQCKVGWSIKFLCSNFDKRWLNDTKSGYKALQEKIALDHEKSLIPETLLGVPEETLKREKNALLKNMRENNKEIKEQIEAIKLKIRHGLSADYLKDRQTIVELDKQLVSNRKLASKISNSTENHSDRGSEFIEEYRVKFICACPKYECRGMISSKKMSCAVCNTRICEDCREKIEHIADHICDKNTVESVKLLVSDSKPCPRCASSIYRISGCNQMFCTNCKIGFSWSTGKINSGNIHNPHALEWFRQRGGPERDIRDIPCGGLPELYDIISVTIYKKLPGDEAFAFSTIYRTISEIDEILGKSQRQIERQTLDNLRMQYVMGDFTETQWKKRISSIQKLHKTTKIKMNIYASCRTIGIERFRDLAMRFHEIKEQITTIEPDSVTRNSTETLFSEKGKKNNKPEHSNIFSLIDHFSILLCTFLEDMKAIRTFINETFEAELKWYVFNASVPQITDSWTWRK
jgi:hypothetical protein